MPPGPRKIPYGFLPVLPRQARGGTVARIQDLVRDAIVRLELPPGTFIDKAALCRRLGVSRFPVSEALGRLAAEGLVEILPQRGTRVTRIDIAGCRQAMFMRRALEVETVHTVAGRADAVLLAALEQNLAGQQDAMARGDRVRFHDLDLALHEMLLDALGFERVKSAVEAARASLDRMRLLMCSPERQATTFTEHQQIVAALTRKDAGGAAAAMSLHLDAVMAELEAVAARQPDAFTPPTQDTVAA